MNTTSSEGERSRSQHSQLGRISSNGVARQRTVEQLLQHREGHYVVLRTAAKGNTTGKEA